MKVVVLQGDGMADEPIPELGGKTPLEVARTPNLDHMAARGILGLTRTIPRGLPPGSDVGTMSVLGYDPARYHTGRSPIEAASMGVELGPEDALVLGARPAPAAAHPARALRDRGRRHRRGGPGERPRRARRPRARDGAGSDRLPRYRLPRQGGVRPARARRAGFPLPARRGAGRGRPPRRPAEEGRGDRELRREDRGPAPRGPARDGGRVARAGHARPPDTVRPEDAHRRPRSLRRLRLGGRAEA